ncbi:transporter, NhaC family (TC 2.A.35) [Dethiosulfatibacter aminovorans DSM 17477]|uniref:Transporter, NhaC family (TC 2.A.35) n=1 Tax=Dethiosulfatibacter aminovorans DSM 17477 TaxID=1121476 RepID=A0A1M6JCT0_9FIRM|nr:Na+/H+ antiporter NhaC family protein [Dethiosulfatibacter aminovorans]SHJ44546.1 transporter, NhaC family (TC 2.A.35) [Dethiosulfatibacter aminovorans DSM 17477]
MENVVEHYGILSLLPPLIAIVLAFTTKQVIPALFAAIWGGAIILSGGNPLAGFAMTIEKYIAGSVASSWNAGIIVFDMALGGTIGIVAKSGGAKAIANWLANKAKSAKSGMVATWAMGLLIFFDDYSNTLLVGTTMRPLTDKLKISREKLSFITDATAAPVASMAFIATWTAYEMGLLRDAFASIGVETNIYGAFLQSIPFRFYSLIMVGFVLMICFTGKDFGPMLKAEARARQTGKLLADGAIPLASKELTEMEISDEIPLRMRNAIIPIVTVIAFVIIGLYVNGRNAILASDNAALIQQIKDTPFAFTVVRDALGYSNASVAMMWASFAGTIVAFALVLSQKILTFRETMDAWVDGAKSLVIAVFVLVLAWGIGGVAKDLGTAKFLIQLLAGKISPNVIPMAVFLLGCLIAFSTGTSWGTTALMMPIAVPLVYELSGGDTGVLLYATIGAVFTGAVFGDHCSPISDTTIMSSMAAASDHIDHVKTQMPYSVTAAVVAVVVGYLPAAVLGINPFISVILGWAVCYAILRVKGQRPEDYVLPEKMHKQA